MDTWPSVEEVLAKLRQRGVTVPAGAMRVDACGDSPGLSESLLALIRCGRKRAGAILLWALEAEAQPLPVPGRIELVVDQLNEPALVCRVTEVQVVAFNEVSAEFAAIEGEGDGSLAHWRGAHRTYFSRECQRTGRPPDERMPVVCSAFDVLSVVPEQAPAARPLE